MRLPISTLFVFLAVLLSTLHPISGEASNNGADSQEGSIDEKSSADECAALSEATLQELEQEKLKVSSCHEELSRTKGDLTAREKALSELMSAKSSDSSELKNLREVAQKQSEEVKNLKDSAEAARVKFEALQRSSSAEIESLKAQVKAAQQQLDAKESDKDKKFAALQRNLADFERKNAQLSDQLKSLKASQQAAEASEGEPAAGEAGDWQKKLEEARGLLEEERRKRTSMESELQFFRQGVHVVAMHRLLEHLETARAALIVFYQDTIRPKTSVAQQFFAEQYASVRETVEKDVLPRVYAELDKLEPQLKQVKEPYEKHVRPYVLVLWEKAGDVYENVLLPGFNVAIEQAETGFEKLQEKFQEFRARGIRTLERNPTTAQHAITIFDGCVFAILFLSALLLGPFLIRISLKLIFFFLLLPFRIFCFCCCCGCCCRSKRKAAKPKKPAKPAKPTQPPAQKEKKQKGAQEKKRK